MSCPLIVVRPEPGCGETVAAARAAGLTAIASPLFAIEPVEWDVPDPAGFDAILAGSANAFRCGGGGLGKLHRLSVHAVGAQTAAAAQTVGFAIATVGESGLQNLLNGLDAPQCLLRLAGEARVGLQIPAGIEVEERAVYRAVRLTLSDQAKAALRGPSVVLLHSGEAARAFSDECDRLGLDRSTIAVAALAPRIAGPAGNGWKAVEIAPTVSDGALLAMAHDMCH